MPVSTDPVAPSASRRATFVRRLASSVVLWSVVLAVLIAGHTPLADGIFLLVMMALAGFGLSEFYDLTERRGWVCYREWGIIGGVLLMASTFVYLSGVVGHQRLPSKANDFETSVLILFVLGLCLRQMFARSPQGGMATIAMTLFGLMYVPWLLNFVQKIHFFPGIEGAYYVLYFILVTKFSDVGAYVVGSLVGRHKMIPRISPGKTWEGFAGALLVSTLVSVVFAQALSERLSGMTLPHAIVLGVLLGATAVVGDLIESVFKREAGVKDSGNRFPGIGGILDLLDSLLFNAPLMYLYLRHVLTRG